MEGAHRVALVIMSSEAPFTAAQAHEFAIKNVAAPAVDDGVLLGPDGFPHQRWVSRLMLSTYM